MEDCLNGAMSLDGPDSLKIGFRKEQLNWCMAHESEMWNYLIEKKMLFSGDRMGQVRFINPAPFTAPFGQKSPGRTGVWLGWQIVKSYMKKNSKVSLKALMENNDYHKILNDSGYSPDWKMSALAKQMFAPAVYKSVGAEMKYRLQWPNLDIPVPNIVSVIL